jgi:RNA polymerase sigma-70 factor (ECF subfamily)
VPSQRPMERETKDLGSVRRQTPRRDDALGEREAEIAELSRRGERNQAFTAAVRLYGPELFGFLVALTGSEADADDVYAKSCEKIWTKLPTFRWDCSLRTWCYVLARRTLQDFLRSGKRATKRLVPLDDVPSVAAFARTGTRPYLKTERLRQLEELRAKLAPADHALLILRVDRQLSWKELALTFADGPLSAEDLDREAARLRQRYRTLKQRLLDELKTLTVDDGG